MKKSMIFVLLVSIMFCVQVFGKVTFDDYFLDETMRIDYFHMADKNTEFFTVDKVYRQGKWAGNPDSTIDNFNSGSYYIKIFDAADNTLIYSRGFDSYCSEYRTTNPAAKGIKRTYHESALIPYPKKEIRFSIHRKNRQNKYDEVFSQNIKPDSVDINRDPLVSGVKVVEYLKSGDPHHKADIAFLAEGYTQAEFEKFKKDLKRMAGSLFDYEPFKSRKSDFNIYGVFKASQDSGPDEPRQGKYRNTPIGCSFNALGLARYMLTEENRAMRDIAAHTPYDAIVIMVNIERYGGGGIYNSFCVFASDNKFNPYLLVHEFGHSFGGLADEYYTSAVSYNDFYPQGIEPTEPNITALLDPQNPKWKHLIKKDTPIPTPWDKEIFDKLERKEHNAFLEKKSKELKDTVGAFEGAGYASKGLYRSQVNCIMFSKSIIPFCKVCQDSISRKINHYTGKD